MLLLLKLSPQQPRPAPDSTVRSETLKEKMELGWSLVVLLATLLSLAHGEGERKDGNSFYVFGIVAAATYKQCAFVDD